MDIFKAVKTYSSRMEAELAKSYLQSSGIKSHIIADDAGQLVPSLGAARGVKLAVTADDLEKARALLEEEQ